MILKSCDREEAPRYLCFSRTPLFQLVNAAGSLPPRKMLLNRVTCYREEAGDGVVTYFLISRDGGERESANICDR